MNAKLFIIYDNSSVFMIKFASETISIYRYDSGRDIAEKYPWALLQS